MGESKKYVVAGMKVKCSEGTMENYISTDTGHGVVYQGQPVLNANDHQKGVNLTHFGDCNSRKIYEEAKKEIDEKYKAEEGDGFFTKVGKDIAKARTKAVIAVKEHLQVHKCEPDTPLPWIFTSKDHMIDGASALTMESQCVCRYGGIITIVPEEAEETIEDINEEETEETRGEENILGDRSENQEIEENVDGLGEKGYQLLIDLELGTNLERYDYIKLTEDGKISAIRNHDVGEGGITVGVGIYVESKDTERIKILEELGINWQDTSQWVPIETVETAFKKCQASYQKSVDNLIKNFNLSLSQEQYDALYLFAYNRPALLAEGGAIYKMIEDGNTNIDDWRTAIMSEYQSLKMWNVYGKGWTNRTEDELELYFYGDYERTH